MGKSFNSSGAAGIRPFEERSKVVAIIVGFGGMAAEMHDAGGDEADGGGCCGVRSNDLAKTVSMHRHFVEIKGKV